MIGHLRGSLFRKTPESLIISCNGVGYQVNVSFQTFCEMPEVGDDVSLEIYHHVKEDRSELYGFTTIREKEMFVQLIGVSGIGPRTGLAILSPHPVSEVEAAIEGENVTFLTKIPGIGKKTAQRVILELKGKLRSEEEGDVPGAVPHAMREDALGVLVNLGYKSSQAEKVLDGVLREHTPEDFEGLLKLAFDKISNV